MFQFGSVTQSYPTLCDPWDCSTPVLPVHHQFLEFTQTHANWVGDAIQPSYPLLSPLLLPSLFPRVRVFSSESVLLISLPKCWSFSFSISPFKEHSGLISSPCSPRDSQESSPTLQFKSISSAAFSFLYGPTLTSIHDYWENHTFAKIPTFVCKVMSLLFFLN